MRLEEIPSHLRLKISGVRTITSKSLGVYKNKEGHPLCKWCLSIVLAPRKQWCSDHCVKQFELLKECPKKIFFKYEGKCSVCDKDVVKLQNVLNSIWELYYRAEALREKLERSTQLEEEFPTKGSDYWKVKKSDVNMYQTMMVNLSEFDGVYPHWLRKMKTGLFRPKRHKAFEIDHVVPICEGGTTTSTNLRLLCTKCHEQTTAELKARRAKNVES